jgi:hypothetical protein
MNEIKVTELEKLLNEMDVCLEEMEIYFDKHPHELTEGAYRLLTEMEDERCALEEVILKIDED